MCVTLRGAEGILHKLNREYCLLCGCKSKIFVLKIYVCCNPCSRLCVNLRYFVLKTEMRRTSLVDIGAECEVSEDSDDTSINEVQFEDTGMNKLIS